MSLKDYFWLEMKCLETVYKCLLSLAILGCNNHQKGGAQQVTDTLISVSQTDSIGLQANQVKDTLYENSNHFDSISVLILPTRCDYDFSLMGYNFTKILKDNLSKDKDLIVPSFPYKTLQGTFYNCVYGKKGCKRILKRKHFDFILMSRYTDGYDIVLRSPENNNEKNYWGYELKLLNANTMQEFVVMQGNNLEAFADLESDIRKKIPSLIDKIKTSFKSNK